MEGLSSRMGWSVPSGSISSCMIDFCKKLFLRFFFFFFFFFLPLEE
jgi:hypothetical protein